MLCKIDIERIERMLQTIRVDEPQCLWCLKKKEDLSLKEILIQEEILCPDCLKKLNPIEKCVIWNGHPLLILFEENEGFKSLWEQFAKNGDIALTPIFLNFFPAVVAWLKRNQKHFRKLSRKRERKKRTSSDRNKFSSNKKHSRKREKHRRSRLFQGKERKNRNKKDRNQKNQNHQKHQKKNADLIKPEIQSGILCSRPLSSAYGKTGFDPLESIFSNSGLDLQFPLYLNQGRMKLKNLENDPLLMDEYQKNKILSRMDGKTADNGICPVTTINHKSKESDTLNMSKDNPDPEPGSARNPDSDPYAYPAVQENRNDEMPCIFDESVDLSVRYEVKLKSLKKEKLYKQKRKIVVFENMPDEAMIQNNPLTQSNEILLVLAANRKSLENIGLSIDKNKNHKNRPNKNTVNQKRLNKKRMDQNTFKRKSPN